MAKSVSEYYATNYTHCKVDDSFFASWQGLAYTSHLTQLVAVPIQIVTFYIILKKTPPCMKCVKWPLLVSHFWCSMLDFTHGTLSTLYVFFPACAMFGVGALHMLHVPILLTIVLILFLFAAVGISMLYLFEVRSSSIQNNTFRITEKSTRMIYYITNCSVFLLLPFSILKQSKDQETARLEILKFIPCPTKEFFTEPTYVLLADQFWSHFLNFYVVPGLILQIGIQVVFFAGCCVYYLYIATPKQISASTRRMQRHFFLGIIVQIGVPSIIVVITYSIMLVTYITDNMTQGIMNMSVVIFGIHGVAESVAIIVVHGPYRRTVWVFLKNNAHFKNSNANDDQKKIPSKIKVSDIQTKYYQ